MCKFLPFMTNDGSVGLYNSECNDIYHSAFGALNEAYNKFIFPAEGVISSKNKLKVLDICYGIGFNTKTLITYTQDKNVSLNIDCVDTNKTLMCLSPFIKTKISKYDILFKNNLLYKNITSYPEAKKITKLKKSLSDKFIISDLTNLIILKNIIECWGHEFLSNIDEKIMTEKENLPFFDESLLRLYKFLDKKGIQLHQNQKIMPFVHNIYYKYISRQYKLYQKADNLPNISLNFHNSDIRVFIKSVSDVYDVIFLDGFTPAKCPCLWSLEFLTELYRHTADNGVLVTYNTSTPVHNALVNAGYYIGNTLDRSNNIIGTIAAKNQAYIKYSLSEKQEGLLNTKAGIMYRDLKLNLDNGTILSNRQIDFENSDLISSSKYLKGYKNEL